MQAKLSVGVTKDLYGFWGSELAETICKETDCIVNLASREYSVCISKYLPMNVRMITCVFGEEKDGKIVEKGTLCKMARGEMVRFMAENRITDPKEIKRFSALDFAYSHERSDEERFVFVLRGQDKAFEFV